MSMSLDKKIEELYIGATSGIDPTFDVSGCEVDENCIIDIRTFITNRGYAVDIALEFYVGGLYLWNNRTCRKIEEARIDYFFRKIPSNKLQEISNHPECPEDIKDKISNLS